VQVVGWVDDRKPNNIELRFPYYWHGTAYNAGGHTTDGKSALRFALPTIATWHYLNTHPFFPTSSNLKKKADSCKNNVKLLLYPFSHQKTCYAYV